MWHGKALANVESEADVLAEAVDGGEVVGKMYTNTILTVEERGDVWSKVSSGSVVGYVKNEMLAFGSDAVARAAAIDMTNPQDAKTLEEIAAEEAAKKAAEEEAARKAAEEAARQSGSSVRYDEAMSASADDQTLLAAIIYCEAGNQPHDGKGGVGAVILNSLVRQSQESLTEYWQVAISRQNVIRQQLMHLQDITQLEMHYISEMEIMVS